MHTKIATQIPITILLFLFILSFSWHCYQDCFWTVGQRVAHSRGLGDVEGLEWLVEHQNLCFGVVEDGLEREAARFTTGKRSGLAA